MSKKSCFGGSFNKLHDEWAEILLKSEWQHLYHIYWSLSKQLRLNKSFWEISKILGLVLNPLIDHDKYCLLNWGNLFQHFQMQLSQKRKIFSNSFLHFLNLHLIFNIFEKNMTLIANVFLNLRTPKYVVI